MTPTPKFWNWIAKRYARQPIADEASYRLKLDVTQDYLRPDMEVLEFGCGTGSTALIHAPHVRQIQGIDFSEKMIEIARDKAQTQDVDNVSFDIATIEDWPDSLRYDAILGLSILHLLEDRDAVLRKVRGLLKPGGLFVSSTVCVGDTKGIVKWLLPIGSALRLLPLVRVFTEGDLLRALRRAGFEVEHNWRPAPDKAVFIVAKAP